MLDNGTLRAAAKGLPADYEEKTWEKLRAAIVAVQRKEPVQYGEEELYKVHLTFFWLAKSIYDRRVAYC